jgi:uncharacterized membrane protein YedE/YeeE
MPQKAAATVLGVVFGFMLCWATLANPDAIRRMLLFEDWYLYAMFPLAIGTGFVGVRLLRVRLSVRTERRHVVGSVLFGLGWAIADACPGPVAAQVGRGLGWSLCTVAGIAAGILIYFRRQEALARRDIADPLRLPLAPAATPEASAQPAG